MRQIHQFVKERQMQVAGLICPTRHPLYAPDFLEERLTVIRNSMDLVRKLGTEHLIFRCGRIPNPAEAPQAQVDDKAEPANPFSFQTGALSSTGSVTPADEFNLLCEILNDLARHGNHVCCIPTLQLARFDIPLIRKLMSLVTSGPLGVTFDPATVVMTGGRVTDIYRDIYDACLYVRARDALRDIDGAGVEVAVGDGVVDWVELLPTLEEADFKGWVCVERTGGDHRAEDVVRGVSHLKSLIPQTID